MGKLDYQFQFLWVLWVQSVQWVLTPCGGHPGTLRSVPTCNMIEEHKEDSCPGHGDRDTSLATELGLIGPRPLFPFHTSLIEEVLLMQMQTPLPLHHVPLEEQGLWTRSLPDTLVSPWVHLEKATAGSTHRS